MEFGCKIAAFDNEPAEGSFVPAPLRVPNRLVQRPDALAEPAVLQPVHELAGLPPLHVVGAAGQLRVLAQECPDQGTGLRERVKLVVIGGAPGLKPGPKKRPQPLMLEQHITTAFGHLNEGPLLRQHPTSELSFYGVGQGVRSIHPQAPAAPAGPRRLLLRATPGTRRALGTRGARGRLAVALG